MASAGMAGHRRNGGKHSATGKKSSRSSAKQRRQLVQMIICSGIFVMLVAVKLLLPQKMAQINERLSRALEQNMDVQAVFSAVGQAFGDGFPQSADEIRQAVFGVDGDEAEVMAPVSMDQADVALDTLHQYRQPEETEEPEIPENPDELTYVLYSNQNLPENVSMEQAILNFDYCTPVSGVLSSGFGYREHPTEGEERFHYGIDLAADTGTDIFCFADGTVTATGESSSYGKYCIVSHDGGYSTLYAHCDRILTSSGTEVKQGTVIAEVGETGMVTGSHLHFELQQDGVYLNPVYYVSGQ